MGKTKKINFDNDVVRVIFVIIGSIFSAVILSFSVLAIIKLQEKNLEEASFYLLFIFVTLGLTRLISFLQEREKVSFIRFILSLIFDIALGITIYFGKNNPYLYSLCGGLFCISIIVSRIFKIILNHTMRSIIFNTLIIIFMGVLAVGLFIPIDIETNFSPIIVVCFIVAISALFEILSGSFSHLKFKTLFKIIVRTYVLEIFLGLLTTMVAAAIVFMYYEESVPTFGDGLWYAFAIVTTIGFGDFAATTLVGRIVTVFLGIYGIIVVAVITSVIVNLYNETAGKNDSKKIKEIDKEEK